VDIQYLQEGVNDPMGVMKDATPRFRAVCRYCGWRSEEHHYPEDAHYKLRDHAKTLGHRQALLDDLAVQHEAWSGREPYQDPFYHESEDAKQCAC